MRPQPLIAVTDVELSSRWYQRLLGCQSDHGGPDYERLVRNVVLILQLHSFLIEHDHGPVGNPADKPYGNGVILWFETDDFDAALARAIEPKSRHRVSPKTQSARWRWRAESLGMLAARSGWISDCHFKSGWIGRGGFRVAVGPGALFVKPRHWSRTAPRDQ